MIHLTKLDFVTVILSVYIVVESLSAIFALPQGLKMLCTKAKYILAFGSSLAFMYYGFKQTTTELQWLVFGAAGTLSFFIWPRTVYRFNHWFNKNLDWMNR